MQKYALFIIVAGVVALDRLTKALILDHLPLSDGFDVTSFLSIVHGRNYGGAFGFLSSHPAGRYVFTLLPLVIIAGLLFYLIKGKLPGVQRVAVAFILGGALGNMYDRLVYGNVIDFIDVHFGEYHWPAFNVADSAITLGIGLWLLTYVVSGER